MDYLVCRCFSWLNYLALTVKGLVILLVYFMCQDESVSIETLFITGQKSPNQ